MVEKLDISGRALLVGLRIRVWSGEKRDKKVTREICEAKGAADKSLRASKSLLGDSIKPVQVAESALRDYANERTLPFMDNGLRIIRSSKVQEFKLGMMEPERAFTRAVSMFIADYATTKERARTTLGLAYSDADFPGAHELPGRFGVDTTFLPMPRADDFRIAMTEDEMEMVRNSCEGAMRDSVRDAVMRAVGQLRKPIALMTERLRGYGKDGQGKAVGIFRDTLVENIRSVIDLAPHLNVTDDPRIDAVVFEMKKHLAVHEGDALRVSPHLRDEVATQAERILKQMDGAFF